MIPYLAFDLDGVLVEGISSWMSVHEAFGVDNEAAHGAYMRGEIDDIQFMISDISLWTSSKRVHIDEIRAILDEVAYVKGAEETVDRVRCMGYRTIIVSGGLDLLAERVARDLRMDHVLANGLETFETGYLTGRGILRVPLRNKAAPLLSLIRRETHDFHLVSVGNSVVDVPMFKISDISIAFNPEDEQAAFSASLAVQSEDLTDILQYIPDPSHLA